MNRERTQDQILRDFLRVLRRQRWLVLAVVFVAVGAGVVYSISKTPVYEATAQLQFNSEQEALSLVGTGIFPTQTPQVQAAADAQIITSPTVARRVARAPGIRLTPAEVKDSVSTSVDPNTDLVTLTVQAGKARDAARLANALARQTRVVATRQQRRTFLKAAKRVRRVLRVKSGTLSPQELALKRNTLSRLQSLAGISNPVTVASPATAPSSPTSPKPALDTALAAVLGLVLGILAAFLRDSFDRRLADAHEVQHQLRLPTVGFIGVEALGGIGISQNGALPGEDLGLEQFRILRSNVEFLAPDRALRTVAITSPVADEGKSTVAAGLATANALAGKRVLLVECDLRRPMLAERFRLSSKPGLTDWLTDKAEAQSVVQLARIPVKHGKGDAPTTRGAGGGLAVVAAGSWSPQPAELLGLPRFSAFLAQVVKVYDLVILDCAPLLPVGDTLQILPLADAALVCVRLDQTTREQALAAKAAIEHFPPRPTGIVVTGIRPGGPGYYYDYQSHTSRQRQATASTSERG
jgi:capsular exopolysaccharide synthesis family protein